MKTSIKKSDKRYLTILKFVVVFSGIIFLSSCNNDDPKKENVPELITEVTLTFTPTGGGDDIVVTATDPDGIGVQDIAADGPITLDANTTYTLKLELVNGLVSPDDEEYNITNEVEEEGVDHMFFFSWTNDAFSDPAGNGNIDNRNDAVNYTGGSNSVDENGLSLGLTTTRTAGGATSGADFRVLLKHQPGLKSASSTSATGDTDLDVSFDLNVVE